MKGPDHPSHYPGQEHKMTEHSTDHDMVARSAPLRLLGPSHATGGEAGPNLNTAAEDECVAPNPVSGSAVPEGRRMERSGSVCNMEHQGCKYCKTAGHHQRND